MPTSSRRRILLSRLQHRICDQSHRFVAEATELQAAGWSFLFVHGTPARSYLKCMIGHNGKHGCDRCTVVGTSVSVTVGSRTRPYSVGFLRGECALRKKNRFVVLQTHHLKLGETMFLFCFPRSFLFISTC